MEVISANVDQQRPRSCEYVKDNGISQVPVFSDEKLVGVLDETDLILPLATGKLKPDRAHHPLDQRLDCYGGSSR
jgi:predicted transcriptional regulator